MQYSIGVDIENISRFKLLDLKKNKYFFEKIYTPKELNYCFSKSNPYIHLATRFSAKEAVIKLMYKFNKKIFYNQIEVINDFNGMPIVNLIGKKFRNINIIISLSHTHDKAIAFALGTINEKKD